MYSVRPFQLFWNVSIVRIASRFGATPLEMMFVCGRYIFELARASSWVIRFASVIWVSVGVASG